MVRIAGRRAGFGVLTVLAIGLMALVPSPASASARTIAPSAVFVFPSSSSTVVGSQGFIDNDEVGYFWSAARGDKVEQTFSGPASVNGILLKASVITNVLNSGAEVDWTISINGIDVGQFVVHQGFTGTLTVKAPFASISGPSYDVKIRVTNEVASGQGSHTLAYAGTLLHGFKLRAG